jgi:hypothetical protein
MPHTRQRRGAPVSSQTSQAKPPRFELERADTSEQFQTAAALRKRVFRDRRNVSFDEALEARRDREGHLFLLSDRGTPLAVGRVLPYPSRLSPLVDLSLVAKRHGADSEIGRVACVADSEAPHAALLLLTLGSSWLLEHTRLSRYVGYCHPKLVELYRKLGAVPGDAMVVPDRKDVHYIISGSYRDAATLGARFLGGA